ncbi:hypothetical protein LC609_23385 [Nostoc sp. XA013]|nr:hypothetical protein [Nostoc sp. XA013]
MQIIQFSLGNNVHPLGVISSLSNSDKMELRKDSHFLHSRSNFISPIQTKPPLVTSSKFFLSRENEPSIQPLIGWDNQDINTEFSLFGDDSFDSIAQPESNNFNSSKSVKDSIPEIIQNRIDNNNSNKALSEIKIKDKPKSKKTNKSQQPAVKKSKPKSNTKKIVKSSTAKNDKKVFDKNNITINFNQDSLLTSDEPISVQIKSEIPILQLNIDSDSSTIENSTINNITPTITAYTSPNIEDKSTLSRNIANDELQFHSELPSSLPSAEAFVAESILPSKEKIELDKDTSELVEDSSIDFPFLNNVQETFTPSRSFSQNEQQVISELVGISDIPVNPTPSKQDIKTYKSPPIANNKNTDFKTNLIQAKEVLPSLNYPSLSKELPHTNSNYETITAIEPNGILESNSNDLVADNVVVDNSLEDAALSSVFTSPHIDDTLYSLANNKNTVETHSHTPKTYVAVPNPESSIAKSPITIQQEISSSITSESSLSTPVQLTPTPADIENTPSLLANSDNNEQLVTSELQSAMAVNFLDGTSPEIGETAISNNKPLGVNAPFPITSPEIAETPVVSATLPEIGGTAISNYKPLGINAPLPITSPEIPETQVVSATSPEISEAAISNNKLLGINAPLPITSPEIPEAPVVSAIPPEISETTISNDKPLGVNAPLTVIPPEIGETAISNYKPLSINAPLPITSPEIAETPVVSATLPEISGTAISNNKPLAINTPLTVIPPEIGEAAISNNKPLGVNAPLPITSPEISETPVVSAIPPEISEVAISNNKPLGVNAPLPITSPEISETPVVSAIPPEITEVAISNDIPLSITSPEIAETQVVSATLPEISEAAISNNKPLGVNAPLPITSPQIAETPVVSAIPPEISEAAISNDKPLGVNTPLTAIPPEIAEAPVVSAIPPEISETTISNDKPLRVNVPLSITSPEINETTVESEFLSAVTNPEIPTFVDTSDNLTSPQDKVSTVPEVEQNTTIENMPAPKGYATGGHVTNSHVENRQQIAPSDTVPAMLTPGEFVINTRDAQKNLPLLHLINTGGTLQDIIAPSLQTPNSVESKEKTSPETSTKVDSFPHTPSQLKSTETHSPQISNSLIPSSLGLDIGKQKLSILNSPQLNPLQKETSDVGEASPQYSSPPMIFRKPNPSTNSPSQWSNTPSQWSSVEDLLNANNDEFTSFNFNDVKSNNQNQKFSNVSQSPQVFTKHLPSPRGFANGGEVTPPDISTEIEPVTETIKNGSSSPEEGDKDDTADLEALAREIYNRLRQRIEIERERHGGHSGRLPW